MANWMIEEMTNLNIVGQVNACDADTEQSMGTFESYEAFRSVYPGAEIVSAEPAANGTTIWC